MIDTVPLLDIRGLSVAFGAVPEPAVSDVDLVVGRAERVAIVGQSGSGKSTVVGAILDLLPGTGRVTSGSIRLDGEDLLTTSVSRMRAVRGRRISLVPQDPGSNLNPSMRVGDQIADALRAGGLKGRTNRRRRAEELMAEAGIPEAGRRSHQYPHEFSGGMRQRVLIAIALAGEPSLLIADEPTSALDVTVQRQILDHLEKLAIERDMALLIITHDLGLAADRADRVVVMCDGRIVEAGSPTRILLDPQEDYTRRLIAAAPSLSSPAVPVPDETDAHVAPILQVSNLGKDYRVRGRRDDVLSAVTDVSFEVGRGTTTAIVGESGSGKTTIARIILGLESATRGTTLLNGQEITRARGRRLADLRRMMQPVFQDPHASLDPTYTIGQLIDEPLRIYGVGDRATRQQRVRDLLDQVALPSRVLHRRSRELSGGQRQRVAIARALALEPELLICDEAVSALDVLVQDQVLTLLSDLQTRLGLSYLFITHDLAVVRQIAHQVVVMRGGRAVEIGDADQVFNAPQDDYTRMLLDAIPGRDFFASAPGGGVTSVSTPH